MEPLQLFAVLPLPPVDRMLGRDSDVAEILDRLATTHVLTLTGAPGVGKSRLAVEVAGQLPRAVKVDVGWLSHPGELESAVTKAIEEGEAAGPAGSDVTSDVPLVLVLDDCDHLLSLCADVVPALVSRGLRILATSREPLSVAGECVWRVKPLRVPGPGQDEVPDLSPESEAVELFCERAASADRDFVPTPENLSAIAEVCRRLDGVPLAIELAARTVTVHAPAEILARLDDPFALLTSGQRTAHPRHQSLWSCLAWSYDVLSVPEQVLLEGVAVFPAAFSDDAVVAVCAPEGMGEVEVSQTLRNLVDKSLIEVENDAAGTRYRLRQMIRWFGVEKLAAGGEEDTQREEHARWCTGVVAAAGDPRRGRPFIERIGPFHHDIHSAIEWAIATGRAEVAVALSEPDARLCMAGGRYRESRERLREVVTAVAGPPELRARALATAGVAEAEASHPVAAVDQLEESLTSAERSGVQMDTARVRLWLAFARVLVGGGSALDGLEAAALEAAPADKAARTMNPRLSVETLIALGQAHLLVAAPARAHDHFVEAVRLAREHDDEIGEAQALVGVGRAETFLGHYVDAEELLGRGLELARAVGEVEAAGAALAALGEAERLQGNVDRAEAWFSEAADLAAAADDTQVRTEALIGLGRVAAERATTVTGREMFEAALRTARAGSLGHLIAPALCGVASLSLDAVEAQKLLDQALEAARGCGDQASEALVLEHVARLSEAQGDVRSATLRHGDALALRTRIGDPAAIANSIEALAGLATQRGDFAVAARLFGAAQALRDLHFCTRPGWLRQQHARTVDLVREALGEETSAVERQHGTSLSPIGALAYAARHGRKRISRPETGWGALTEAERTIAELVACGRTNAEIARERGITASTVKAHLRSAFAKVGVQNRTALAAAMPVPGGQAR